MKKQRLSASVDAELIEAAEAAVAAGTSETVSAWVNDALRLKLEHDRRLQALAEFIRQYELEHGEISPDEVRTARRNALIRATAVRPIVPSTAGRARRARAR